MCCGVSGKGYLGLRINRYVTQLLTRCQVSNIRKSVGCNLPVMLPELLMVTIFMMVKLFEKLYDRFLNMFVITIRYIRLPVSKMRFS
jgi:hypothetical protein